MGACKEKITTMHADMIVYTVIYIRKGLTYYLNCREEEKEDDLVI